MNYGPIVQAILFALFAAITAAVSAVIEPTYDLLFVPQMSPSVAFASWSGGDLYAQAAAFSNFLLVTVVDPLAILVIVGVGFLYLARATLPSPRLSGLAPRLLIALLAANLVIPLASAAWEVAGAIYPIFYNYQGGAWQTYANLVGPGGITLSWDNGLVALIVSLVLLTLVFLLAFLVAFRSALVGVLLVLLPLLTLLWALPPVAGLARRGWSLFVEMTFLPCFLVVPLVLAVGSSNVLLTLSLFAVAVSMPQLLSLAGSSLSQLGFPHGGATVGGGFSRAVDSTQQSSSTIAQGGARGFLRGFQSGRGAATGSAAAKAGGASGSSLGGPAGMVAWGVQQGVGELARRLGGHVGRALGRGEQDAAPPVRSASSGAPALAKPPAPLPPQRRISSAA